MSRLGYRPCLVQLPRVPVLPGAASEGDGAANPATVPKRASESHPWVPRFNGVDRTALLVAGARPNFVKIAPIVAAMRRNGRLRPILVHTGQHYDDAMSAAFFRELEIPEPDINLGVGSGSHAEQTAAVMVALERVIAEQRPAIVVTVGDVNSTLAAALVAAKASVPQAHVEAGLRSGDATMPEEVNRIVTDRLADVLLTHCEEADANLRSEGAPEQAIRRVGNVMIDTLLRVRPRWQGAAASLRNTCHRPYAVITLHRPANVDDVETLRSLVDTLRRLATEVDLFFPVHPRTRARLAGIDTTGITVIEPLRYTAFLDLVEHARLVLTDSGGIQEETSVLGVPCLTLRNNTERPVTVRLGTNRLIGTNPAAIGPAATEVLASPMPSPAVIPLWDGHAAERAVDALTEHLGSHRPMRLVA